MRRVVLVVEPLGGRNHRKDKGEEGGGKRRNRNKEKNDDKGEKEMFKTRASYDRARGQERVVNSTSSLLRCYAGMAVGFAAGIWAPTCPQEAPRGPQEAPKRPPRDP